MIWDQVMWYVSLQRQQSALGRLCRVPRVSSKGYWSLRKALLGAGDNPDSCWWLVQPTLSTKGLAAAAAHAKPGSAKAVGGARRPPDSGLVLVGGARAEPNFPGGAQLR